MKLRPFLRNIISIVLFCSCQNHISIQETYVFRNQSGSDIKAYRTHYNMDSIVFLFEIPKNKSYTLKSDWAEASHLREVGPFAHFPFPFFSLDTTFFVFDQNRKLSYSIFSANDCTIPNNIHCKKSYTTVEVSNFEYTYVYTFTEKDYNNATPLAFGEGLVGSVWRCTEGAGLQEGLGYNELRFVTENTLEGWVLFEGESQAEMLFTASYSIEGESIIVTDEGDQFTATLNDDYTGLYTNIDDGGECVFVKQ